MARPRSAMRKIREILRLTHAQGLSWPLPEGMDDAQLEARLFAKAEPPPAATRPRPDWTLVHRELRRAGVTLQLLWIERRAGRRALDPRGAAQAPSMC